MRARRKRHRGIRKLRSIPKLDVFLGAVVVLSIFVAVGGFWLAIFGVTQALGRVDLMTCATVTGLVSGLSLRAIRRHRVIARFKATRRAQIAGMTCGTCEEDIVRECDADLCQACKVPLHHGMCHSRHARVAHGPTQTSPYRGT